MAVEPAATITIPNADPYSRGFSETLGGDTTGIFELGANFRIEIETRTESFFQSSGASEQAVSVMLDFWENATGQELSEGEGLRQELSLDLGGGIHAVTFDFQGYEGSSLRWGDSGDGGTRGDATGEDVAAQMSVLDRYLNTARLDSTNPAQVAFGEYGPNGRYAAWNAIPENPDILFDSRDQSSTFDGSLTWIETTSLARAIDSTMQTDF